MKGNNIHKFLKKISNNHSLFFNIFIFILLLISFYLCCIKTIEGIETINNEGEVKSIARLISVVEVATYVIGLSIINCCLVILAKNILVEIKKIK